MSQFNLVMSPLVKKLIIINVGFWFLAQILLDKLLSVPITSYLSLIPHSFLFELQIWRAFTYMFLHSFEPLHIVFNMIILWFVGSELEFRWGQKYFLTYYLICGVGAALIYTAGNLLYFYLAKGVVGMSAPVVGASGGIFGLLLAYGILFGERMIYFFGVFPIKAKWAVTIMGTIELASLIVSDSSRGNVAYLAHLGGLATGYLTLLITANIKKSQKAKKSRRGNLHLVVDNEKDEKSKHPRYWN